MRLMTLAVRLALLAFLAIAPSGVNAEEESAPPAVDLSGDWQLNEQMSETLRGKMSEAIIESSDNPRTRERWSRMEMRERQFSRSAGFSALTIEQEGMLTRVQYGDGRVRSLHGDGRELEPEPAYGINAVRATWEGRRLVVESDTTRGKQVESWELSEDGLRLFVTTEVDAGERFGGRISYRRIYDRVPPEAPPVETEADEPATDEPSPTEDDGL